MPDITVCCLYMGRELLSFLVAFFTAWEITCEVPRCLRMDNPCHESNATCRSAYEITYEPVVY
jgi:hypothetical protein